MGLQVRDLILEDVSHCLTSFLKTQDIALCPWNQERIIYTLKGSGDPKNNRLYLEEMPPEASVLPSLCPSLLTVLDPNPNLSSPLILPKSVDPREGNEDPFAEPHQLQSLLRSSPPPSLQSCKRGSGESRLPQTIQDSIASPRPSPRPPPAAFVQRRQRKKKTKRTEGEGATSAGRRAVGSQDEPCGWGSRWRLQGL